MKRGVFISGNSEVQEKSTTTLLSLQLKGISDPVSGSCRLHVYNNGQPLQSCHYSVLSLWLHRPQRNMDNNKTLVTATLEQRT